MSWLNKSLVCNWVISVVKFQKVPRASEFCQIPDFLGNWTEMPLSSDSWVSNHSKIWILMILKILCNISFYQTIPSFFKFFLSQGHVFVTLSPGEFSQWMCFLVPLGFKLWSPALICKTIQNLTNQNELKKAANSLYLLCRYLLILTLIHKTAQLAAVLFLLFSF